MFATLPDFTPRDSHSLWYTSSRAPILGGLPDGLGGAGFHDGLHGSHHHGTNQQNQQSARQRGQVLERTALARLAADEAEMHRRRINVQNYGSTWLKPPGIPKTLHQMREEKREQEEHQEAMRREQLAHELAEAEAEAAGREEDDEEAMDDVQLDGAQDLDDEIPDADDDFALGGGSSSEEEEEEEDEEDDDDGGEEDADDNVVADRSALEDAMREERRNDLMAARMRMTDDAFREALVRGDPDGVDMYGGGEELDEHGQGHLLDEEDFLPSSMLEGDMDDADLGMDANLDDDIPEAPDNDGGYEHTDSDAALSSDEREDNSSDEDDEDVDDDIGFAPRAAPLGPPQSPTLRGQRHGHHRRSTGVSAGPRSSMDLSAFLSQDESSFMDSSPVQGRRNMRG